MLISKKMIFSALPILILFASLPLGTAHADVELIVNGDFETGDLTGWTPVGPVFDGEVTSEYSHSGIYSLKLGVVDFVGQVFNPAVSTTGDLTFWAKTEGFAGAANVKVEYSDETSDNLPFGGAALSPVGEWKQFTVSVNPVKQVSRLEFSAWETAPIYIDDVSLSGPFTSVTYLTPISVTRVTPIITLTPITKLTPIGPITITFQCNNVIKNRGFETGDLTGWTPVGPVFDGGVTSEQARSGSYSLQLGAVDFIEQTFSQAVSPTSNLVFWAKTEGFAGAANALVEYADGTSDSLLFGGANLSPEWKQFTVSVNQVKQVNRLEFSAWETAPIYIDDVSLCGQQTTKPVITKTPYTILTPVFPVTPVTPITRITITYITPSATVLCADVIDNGDFETGDLPGWAPIGPMFDGGVTSEHAHTGMYSLELGAVDFIEQQFSYPVSVTGNMTFWAKTEGFAGAANAKVEYADGTSDSLLFGGADLSPVGEWKQFTVTLDPTKQVSRLEFSTWETAPIYIDDVSLCVELSLIKPIVTTSDTEPITKTGPDTTTETDGEPTPGFMSLSTLIGLAVITLIIRKRRT